MVHPALNFCNSRRNVRPDALAIVAALIAPVLFPATVWFENMMAAYDTFQARHRQAICELTNALAISSPMRHAYNSLQDMYVQRKQRCLRVGVLITFLAHAATRYDRWSL